MSTASKRYPLILYTHTINRWWPELAALGLALFGLAWAIYLWHMETWRWLTIANLGGVILIFAMLLYGFRNFAHIQLFAHHFRLVTPFLRLNVSYQRVRRSTTVLMYSIFPPRSVSGWGRELLEPLSSKTAVVLDLNGFPVSPLLLRLLLSPFFFKDKTPHIVLLVEDWMGLSTDLESHRLSLQKTTPTSSVLDQSILNRLPYK
jgi:hypothetical protein